MHSPQDPEFVPPPDEGDLQAGLQRLKELEVPGGRPNRGPITALAALAVLALIVVVGLFAVASLLTGGEDEAGTAVGGAEGDDGPAFGYAENLEMIRGHSKRNTLLDDSPFRDTPVDELDISDTSPLIGDRVEYLNDPNGNPEQSFPIPPGGQFRTSCEFSHFAYDDPILFPNEPGKAHLHMFFGNTDINAYSTYETMRDSGSSTCNGQELNRSGYWAPAMIDGDGNVRIPERVVIYYKGEGLANGANWPEVANAGAQPYEPRMANIASQPSSVPEVPTADGGEESEFNFACTDNFSGEPFTTGIDTIPNCSGDHYLTGEIEYPLTRTVLEMKVLFYNCWESEGEDDDWTRWKPSGEGRGSWYFSNCRGEVSDGGNPLPVTDEGIFPNITYFVNYVVEPGEDTSTWFLSSDIDGSDPTRPRMAGNPGSSHHADWWGAWHPDINQEFLDNCVNFSLDPTPSGCGFGYLSDGGTDPQNPLPGRALKYRRQYDEAGNGDDYKVSLEDLFGQLCQPLQPAHEYKSSEPMTGAFCKP